MKPISKILFIIQVFLMMTYSHKAFSQCTPVGDPAVFGDHVWNEYVYNSPNWTDNYVGYDVFTDLNYFSATKWFFSNPTTSATYQGCPMPVNSTNFSWSVKREGFDSGIYTINILQHASASQLYVNGNLVWSVGTTGQSYYFVWTGELNNTSTVEFRVEATISAVAIGRLEIIPPCAQGNPAVFGDHVWNQYVWSSTNWTDNYLGYDVFTGLNYNSQTKWNSSGNPTTSGTYQGCLMSFNDNFTWSSKRKGFDSGAYTITIPQYNDVAELYLNGALLWSTSCCGAIFNGWTGVLDSSSTVEFRVKEISQQAFGNIQVIPVCSPTGNPAGFGDHVWNVYTYNNSSPAWNPDDYVGYFSASALNFNSSSYWNYDASTPSDAPGYSGCPAGLCNYSWSAKRKGFDCGIYSVQRPTNSMGTLTTGYLIIHGVVVQTITNYYQAFLWIGYLDDTSTVEFKVTENSICGSKGELDFVSVSTYPITVHGSVSICPGYSETLSMDFPGTYLWNTGETTSSISVNSTGTYSVTVSLPGGCSFTSSQSITVQPVPIPTTTVYGSNPYFACNGIPQLGVSNFSYVYTYNWNNGLQGNVITPAGAGDYTVTATDALGCVSSPSANLHLEEGTNSGDTTVFGDHQWNVYVHSDYSPAVDGDGYNYNAVPGTSYYYAGYLVDTNLSFNSENHWTPLSNPSTWAGYIGCSTTDDHYHFNAKRQGFDCGIYQIDVPTHDDDAWLYVNDTLVWSDLCCSAYTNAWTGVLNSDSKVEFKVREYGGACTGSVQLTKLQSFSPLIPTISGPTAICGTNAISLDAGSGFSSYSWSTGSTTQTTSVSTQGNYSVKVTDANGCVSISTVTISPAPTVNFYADNDHDSYGDPLNFVQSCSAPAGYLSDDQDCDDSNDAVHPDATEVCNSIDDNCNGIADESGLSAAVSTTDAVTFCASGATLLKASPTGNGYLYQWNNESGTIAGATSSTYAADATGNYSVVVYQALCVAGSNSISITELPLPLPAIDPAGPIASCKYIPVTLTANTGIGLTYQWYKNNMQLPGATNSTYTTNGTQAGNFKVLEKNNFGCASTSSVVNVSRLATPTANNISVVNPPGNPDLCVIGKVKLRGVGSSTVPLGYQWSDGSGIIPGATNRDYTTTATGTFTVKVTNLNTGCSKISPPVSVIATCKIAGNSYLSGDLKMYPNPTNGHFVINLELSSDENGEATLQIFNTLGQSVMAENVMVEDGELIKEIGLKENDPVGIYFVRIVLDDQIFNGQVVYEK